MDAERENFEKTQALSINKAINNQETPVKEKHIRKTIIGTFQDKGAVIFWSVATKLPLQGNPIVCWKFCHTLHKILREGHPQVIPESQRFKNELESLGKLWGHLKEGYGKLIAHYTKLLVVKLDFHRKNPRFPGNMQVTAEQLDDIGEHDVNNYFQITVEMFDYMDEILNLQAAVFGSLDMSRSNSMTSTGQCRLAPLIPCIQDSSQLYDYCVKLLFKLHSSLPPDTLIGHSDRFRKQFYQLKQFYINSSTLQYFKYLIQIPLLPENPPNFLVQADLSSHLSPVVILPPQAETPDNDSVSDMVLVDTTSTDLLGADVGDRNGSISPEQLTEKERLIEQLLREIEDLKMELQRVQIETHRVIDDLRRQLTVLDSQLADQQRIIAQKDQELEELRKKLSESSSNKDAELLLVDVEKKAKANEEKFSKMKDVYNKLREEHIGLLRTKADVDKQLVQSAKAQEEAHQAKVDLEGRLQKVISEKQIAEEVLQKNSSDTSQQLASALSAKEDLLKAKQESDDQLHLVQAEKASLEDQIRELQVSRNDLESRLQVIEIQRRENEQQSRQKIRDDQFALLVSCIEETEHIVHHSVEEVDNPSFSSLKCTPEYLLSQLEPLNTSLDKLQTGYEQFSSEPNSVDPLLRSITSFGHLLCQCILNGKATSNASPDIEKGDRLTNVCKEAGKTTLDLLKQLKNRESDKQEILNEIVTVKNSIEKLQALTEGLVTQMTQSENIGDLVENELHSMDKAIEEAAKRFEDLLGKSRQADTGVKLEVNSKIIDSCTSLMQAIRVLVQRAKILQEEIVGQGKGTASVKEFYKRNHRWTEGLLSAAKAVGFGAKFLVGAADKVLSGEAKFEELMVASQEIAASTAQLVVASKVKADCNSENLIRLSQASKGVTEATGNVVATSKSCAEMLDESDVMDFSKLSLHQAKRLEMDSQVRVLELEQSLSQERVRFASLRRQHYSLAGPSEGWDEEDIPK